MPKKFEFKYIGVSGNLVKLYCYMFLL